MTLDEETRQKLQSAARDATSSCARARKEQKNERETKKKPQVLKAK